MTPSTIHGRRAARPTALIIFGLALAAGLVGCSGPRSSSSATGTADKAGPAPAVGFAQGGAAQGQGSAGAAVKPEQLPQTQRSIIYTGTITVRVDKVNQAADQLVAIASGAGGFVGGDQRSSDANRSTATLTLRIPADKFTRTLDDISHVTGGHEQNRQVSTQDVTADVIDLAARIQAQQASVDRVRALLAKAQTISEITSVESELSRRESDLESLQAKQRSLGDLTALSTITVTLLGPDAPAPPAPKKATTGFLAGLAAGWHAFTASLRVLLTVLGALLPFLIAFGVPALAVLWWLRRRRTPVTPKPGTEV